MKSRIITIGILILFLGCGLAYAAEPRFYGGGGSGSITSSTSGYVTYYSSTGTTIDGYSGVTVSNNNLYVSGVTVMKSGDGGSGDMTKSAYDNDEDGYVDSDAGGTDADLSGVTGLMGVAGGTYVDIDTAAELETYANLGALFSDYADDADEATFKATLNLEAGTDYYSVAAADAAFESADSAIMKNDEAETMTALLTLKGLDYTPQTAASSGTTSEVRIFDNDTYDPANYAGTNDYMGLCTVAGNPGTWVAIRDMVTGNPILSELALPSDESTDASLDTIGEIHVRGDEDRFSIHAGAGGEIAGEVTKSMLDFGAWATDPGAAYDSDTEYFLFEVNADVYPNGIIIDEWSCSCNVDPDVEINADLRRATAWIGLGSAADIDEIDTTNGTSSEDTDANINGGSAVAAGQVIYIGFDADPEGTCTQMMFDMVWHGEED